ncbi:hypothetical protein GCM10010435_21950 [Winogradskya consettensis]|uniref:Lipoprotein n=1 Tax=Winogradskya consettensis TaxID=113560 RepID=A0A919S6R1_9ACTN|nr:hypothetical protein [Actinoplanes consettensis]GIM66631.1 hypothetical protein Aco04nite_02760 [Actinoplanes consettensis]
MRSLGTRRAVLATGVAAVAAIALAGCSAGQVAETSLKKPSNPGVNADNANRSVFVRNLSVEYHGTEGYAAGDNATLEVGLYNQTDAAITVLISSQPVATGSVVGTDVISAKQVGLVGGALPSASDSPSEDPSPSSSPAPSSSKRPKASAAPSESASEAPAGPAVAAARIVLPPLGGATFLPDAAQKLQLIELSDKLVPGGAVNLVFEFSNNADPLVVQAPVSTPLIPASRVPGDTAEGHEE